MHQIEVKNKKTMVMKQYNSASIYLSQTVGIVGIRIYIINRSYYFISIQIILLFLLIFIIVY